MSYCDIAPANPYHAPYHENEYGFPVEGDDALFERLVLEINQAGLSWLTILKKRDAFREAFAGFDIDRVARFTPAKRAKLMTNAGIIRNRLKIEAAVENAKRLRKLGSFAEWLDASAPPPGSAQASDYWVRLFKKTFVFTGGEITTSFLISIGYLPGAHDETCPVYKRVLKAKPRWAVGSKH
jgi:DNA-3-methyladenine glycosylase I